ncbi:MAG: hypothetical protein HOF72_09200, partial [Planctomycetaceae bacterium]|nr:hypothetical protein [Planctomycetaceae bacterium]
GQSDVGKVSGVVAAGLPVYDDFNDNIAEDFNDADGTWEVAEGRFTSQNLNGTSMATLNLGVDLPNKYLMRATLQSPSLNNRYANGGFVFDYVSDTTAIQLRRIPSLSTIPQRESCRRSSRLSITAGSFHISSFTLLRVH